MDFLVGVLAALVFALAFQFIVLAILSAGMGDTSGKRERDDQITYKRPDGGNFF